MVPLGNHLVVDLGKQEGNVPGISQAVHSTTPDGHRHFHVLHIVERQTDLKGWKPRGLQRRAIAAMQ